MRPLFYDFPQDREAWNIEDEFMFGPDLLVAPVLYEGARARKVYLPNGSSWKEKVRVTFMKAAFGSKALLQLKIYRYF